MKKVIYEDENEGLEMLLGEKVIIFTSGYFYTGTLEGVNKTCIKLKDPSIVYETGKFSESKWKDEQSLCADHWYVSTHSIESFGKSK